MSIDSQKISPELAVSLCEKSDQELLCILENPDDWRPEVIAFARSELGRRSLSTAQIDEKLAEQARQRAELLGPKANEPMSFWESFRTILYGGGLGFIGLFCVWPQASRFESEGYILKSKKSWSLYWTAFGIRVGIVAIVILFVVLFR